MALEPVPSIPPVVVIAHDDPGTADSLRHAVEAAGWQALLADPSASGHSRFRANWRAAWAAVPPWPEKPKTTGVRLVFAEAGACTSASRPTPSTVNSTRS